MMDLYYYQLEHIIQNYLLVYLVYQLIEVQRSSHTGPWMMDLYYYQLEHIIQNYLLV